MRGCGGRATRRLQEGLAHERRGKQLRIVALEKAGDGLRRVVTSEVGVDQRYDILRVRLILIGGCHYNYREASLCLSIIKH